MVAFAGSGELGDGSAGVLEKVENVGIGKLLKLKTFPATFTVGGVSYSFIVICPQMKSENDWQNSIQAILDYAKANYRVDEKKVYLTGLSLGGVGTFSYCASTTWRGQTLAAAVLVCPGTGANAFQLKNIAASQIPFWVTNNADDPINSATQATALVNSINTTSPPPPTKSLLTIFPAAGRGHDAWTQTYDPSFTQEGLNVYQWMLSKSRASVPAPLVITNAGPDQTITLPTNSVTLDASKSRVTSGAIYSYTWTKFSGPSSGVLSLVSGGLQGNLTGLAAGKYVYQLVVRDMLGNSAIDMVTINVNSTNNVSTDPPTANAGANQIITLPVNTAKLDGSASAASAGNTIVSYKWTKATSSPSGGDIASSTSAVTTVSNLIAGTYTYSLLVTDNRGATKTATTTIIVNAAATSTDPPTVNAGLGQTITLPVNTATLDGSLSKASSGNTIVSYKWTKATSSPSGGDIASPTSVKTTIANLIAGTYTYSLTVTDSRGSSKTGGTVVIVNGTAASTDPPTVNAGLGQNITLPVNTATLDGSLSKASSGNTIVSYKWTKATSSPSGGDITSPTSVKTTITNLIAGTYTYSLTVTDSRGSSKTGGTVVVVNPGTAASTDPPTAKVAQSSISLTLPTNSVTLDGSSSVASAGNTIASYKWTKYTGPSYDGLKTPTESKITVTGLVAGSYGFTITVTDNNGKTSSANVAVVVNAAVANRTANPDEVAATALPSMVDVNKVLDFKVSPNPVQSNMNIQLNGTAAGKASILVYNVAGQLQLQQEFRKDGGAVNKSVNISRLPAGIYIVHIIVDDKYKKILRIVKQQ